MARQRLSTVNFGVSNGGLATVGYTLYNTNGTEHQARTTAGVTEFGTTTGVYGATINLPSDKAVLVMWDTGVGGGDTRYGSEDNNTALDSIQDGTDMIRLIWNSIKNQGEFFAAVMDKLGLIQKNKGLVKQDLDDAIGSIKFPDPPIIKIPEFPAMKEILNKVDTTRVEKMMSDLSASVEKQASAFAGTQKFIQGAINAASKSIKADATTETRLRAESVITELRKIHGMFVRFESLVSKINDLGPKLDKLDSNDKDLVKAKNEIHQEIKNMNTLMNAIAVLNRVSTQKEKSNELIFAFGGKK